MMKHGCYFFLWSLCHKTSPTPMLPHVTAKFQCNVDIYNHFNNRLHVKCVININWKWLWPIDYKLVYPCTYICHSWHCHSLLRFFHSWHVILYLKFFYMADMLLYLMPTCHIFLTIIHNAFPLELLHSDFVLSPWYIHEYWFFSTEQSD